MALRDLTEYGKGLKGLFGSSRVMLLNPHLLKGDESYYLPSEQAPASALWVKVLWFCRRKFRREKDISSQDGCSTWYEQLGEGMTVKGGNVCIFHSTPSLVMETLLADESDRWGLALWKTSTNMVWWLPRQGNGAICEQAWNPQIKQVLFCS